MGASARPGQKGRERKSTPVTNRSGILFDLLNESNGLGIADLNVENRKNLLTVRTEDGSVFELVCREGKWMEERKLTVYNGRGAFKEAPPILLQNKWLERAGFNVGEK